MLHSDAHKTPDPHEAVEPNFTKGVFKRLKRVLLLPAVHTFEASLSNTPGIILYRDALLR